MLSPVLMYAVAGRDFRSGIELKITSRIYRVPLPPSTAATRGNGNTAKHLCRMDFYCYRELRTWKQVFKVSEKMTEQIIVPFHFIVKCILIAKREKKLFVKIKVCVKIKVLILFLYIYI